MKKIISKSEKETIQLGNELGKTCRGGEIFALEGDLGAGKTKFIQGLAKGLGVKEKINSPTFNIIKVYKIKDNKQIKSFYHVDTYRLQSDEDLINLGALEFLKDSQAVIAIEWPEKIKKLLSKQAKTIKIKHKTETEREIVIK